MKNGLNEVTGPKETYTEERNEVSINLLRRLGFRIMYHLEVLVKYVR